jgi:anti-sigma factor RsiW
MKPQVGKDNQLSDALEYVPQKRCRRIRQWVLGSLSRKIGPEARWIQRHAAHCPRCQKRLAAWNRVELALSAIKSQPHQLDLLKRANTHALSILKHSLREATKAQTLRDLRPEPSFMERTAQYRHGLGHIAACLAIVALVRTGLFASLDKACSRGQQCMRQYYVAQVGEDLADEVFEA